MSPILNWSARAPARRATHRTVPSRKLLAVIAGLAMALPLVFAGPVFAAAPRPLDGEQLSYAYDQPFGPDNHITITQTCDPAGISTIAFDGAGVATGPYPGTFTATGTATVGPQTLPVTFAGWRDAQLLTFDEVFHISSPAGDVTGTKTLSVAVAGNGACFDIDESAPTDEPPFYDNFGYLYDADGTMAYDVIITSGTVTAHDSGTNYSNVSTIRRCYIYGDPVIDQGCGFGIGIDEYNFVSTAFSSDAPVTPVVMGPQAMEGDLKVPMGSTLKVGYDFTIPGSHVAQTVSFVGAHVDFAYTCVDGPSTPHGVTPIGSGTLSVPMADAANLDPANSSAWYPSAKQTDASTFQGSLQLATDLCTANGLVRLQKGGTFYAGIASDGNHEKINIRWHYSANGSAGGWSGTKGVVPN